MILDKEEKFSLPKYWVKPHHFLKRAFTKSLAVSI